MNKLLIIMALAVFTGCATAPPADPITTIKVNLPDTTKWVQITNKSEANQYIREWVPEGSSGVDTKWLIVEQKITTSSSVNAKKYIKTIMALAKHACSDVLYIGPEKIEINGHDTFAGRFMCAQQKGKSYGTFTDQRVAVQGNEVYVVTSELRTPSSPKAGTIAYGEIADIHAFVEQSELSWNFVRSVNICTTKTEGCQSI